MSRASAVASYAVELFAAVVAPARCAACDARVALLSVFCGACAAGVERVRADDADALAAFEYGGAVARAITRLKYERRPDLARPLGDLLWRAIEPRAEALRELVVVPVPLHPVRLAERGYNQSALVAQRASSRLGARFAPVALERTRDTPRQATLDRAARLANVAGAFGVRDGRALRGRAVLLVDDVRTTGATLEVCARAALEAGATRVATAVIAVARG